MGSNQSENSKKEDKEIPQEDVNKSSINKESKDINKSFDDKYIYNENNPSNKSKPFNKKEPQKHDELLRNSSYNFFYHNTEPSIQNKLPEKLIKQEAKKEIEKERKIVKIILNI